MQYSKHKQEIQKTLEAIMHKGYSNYTVMQDFISLTFYAFQRDDANYLKVMARYRNEGNTGKREADYFAAALGQLMIAMKETNGEYLGDLYMEYASSQFKGQFFTPWHVCQMMAKLTHQERDFPKDRTITVNDPACGAGAMLLAFGKELSFEENGRVLFVAQDIDLHCCQMTALNLMFYNYNGIIIHGDTLSLDVYGAWETKRSLVYGGSISPISTDVAKEMLEKSLATQKKEEEKILQENINKKPLQKPVGNLQKPVQLSLFG